MAYHSTQLTDIKVTISATPTTIPQVYEITPPGIERRFKDVTHLASSGNFTEYRALMNDTSEASFKMWWDPDNTVHDYLMDQAILATAVTDTFKITLTNSGASTMEFTAYVMAFKPTINTNDVYDAEVGMRVTGAITYTQ